MYSEKEKKIAREECLSAAVNILTKERSTAPLAPRSYVRDVKDFLIGHGTVYDRAEATKLSDKTICQWEALYDALLPAKQAKDLKVAYLAGPNPENDLEVLTSLGVLPENVWAVESDNVTYRAAVTSTLKSRFPYLKLFKGSSSAFFSLAPVKCDLVYFDFCGPILDQGKGSGNLHALFVFLQQHVLQSPGVLITNCAFPTKAQDEKGWDLLTKLMACYLYPKDFLESSQRGSMIEGPIAHSMEPLDFREEIHRNSDFYYSQFVTRLLMDLSSAIVPYQSIWSNPQVIKLFFSFDEEAMNEDIKLFYDFSDEGEGGDVVSQPVEFPLLWTLASLNKNVNYRGYAPFKDQDPDFANYASRFLRQISQNQQEHETINRLERLIFLLSEEEGPRKYYTEPLEKLSQRHWSREMYQFCDLVLFHQIKELLIRQLVIPYHVNVARHTRWTYVAREQRMYLDLAVLDECRYIYDWMPTLDILESGVDDIERQYVYRFALDAVNKHRRWYNPEYFSGTGVIDQYREPFEAKELIPRKVIN